MARIRTIKPEFFHHDGLGRLSPLHRLLYIGLWCQADREGRLPDRPARLRVAILPYDAVDDAALDNLLWDLAEHPERFIVRYADVAGTAYIAIPTFSQHQRPHPKDAESCIPAPEGDTGVTLRQRNGNGVPCNSGEIQGKKLNFGHAPLSKSPRVQESKGECEGGKIATLKSTTRPPRSHRAPTDFLLTAELGTFGLQEGLPDQRAVRDEFAKFKDHEYRDPHSDWNAAWRNWVRTAVRLRKQGRRQQVTDETGFVG